MRDLYEKKVEEKARRLKEKIAPTSLRATIEEGCVGISITVGWVDASSTDVLTKREILQYVKWRCKREASG